jgi:hypothetical protein
MAFRQSSVSIMIDLGLLRAKMKKITPWHTPPTPRRVAARSVARSQMLEVYRFVMRKVTRHGGGESGKSLFQSTTADGVRSLPAKWAADGSVRRPHGVTELPDPAVDLYIYRQRPGWFEDLVRLWGSYKRVYQ